MPRAAVVRAQLSLEVELAGSGDAVRVLPVGAQIANDLDMIKIFNEYGQHREGFSISKEACLLKEVWTP